MNLIYRHLRKTSVILCVTFSGFAIILVAIMTTAYDYNWNQLFYKYQEEKLKVNGYVIMDDMRNEGLITGPFSSDQTAWLNRRSIHYGFFMKYESVERDGSTWFDMISGVAENRLSDTLEFPFVALGEIQGYLTVSSLKNELDPAFVSYQETMQSRSVVVFTTVVTISILVSILLARTLTVHLNHLTNSSAEILLGRRDVRVELKGTNEIRKLAQTLNQLSEELKLQENWRNNLMEDLTHELRTPLTSVLAQIEAIIDGVYQGDAERFQEIYDELIRFSSLVNDMERLTDAEAAKFNLQIRRSDMIKLTKRVHYIFEPLAKEKGVKLQIRSVNVPCFADVDSDKMIQVISNIVSNAIKYTLPGGLITVDVSWNAKNTIISCEDTGIGISMKDLPYIFNRLYRVDKSRSRFSGGVGLGLTIAQALIHAHNGNITVTSEVGIGSKFIITVPNEYKNEFGV